MQSQALYKGL